MIPVGLLASWIFVSTAFALGDILSAASNFGLLSGISDWLGFGPSNRRLFVNNNWANGTSERQRLELAEATETFTRMSLPQISCTSFDRTALSELDRDLVGTSSRQEHGQFLEG